MISTLGKKFSGKIVKGLTAVWFGDKTILQFSKDVVTEAVGQQVDDYMQSRKTTRMLSEIEDELIEKIGTFLNVEFRAERPGDLALIVEDCVNFTSSDEFFNAVIQNAFCEDDLLELYKERNSNRYKELSVKREVYDTISRFIIAHYLAFTAALPKFEKTTLVHLLKDTDEIIDRLVQIDLRIADLTSKSLPDDDRNRREFLKASMKSFEKISIFGVDGRRSPKKYDLSVAYINLNASNSDDEELSTTEELVSAALLKEAPLTVVTGEPGSGKTTLLSWITLQAAKRERFGSLNLGVSLLPIFIRLREYSNEGLPKGMALLDQQLGVAKDSIEDTWKQKQLADGKFLFLFDGLDEVSEAKRDAVTEWCREIIETWPKSKVIVSSRPYASSHIYDLIDEYGSEEQTLVVEPMDLRQTEALIDHWYKSYAYNLSDKDDRGKARICAEKLKNRLGSSSNLRSITKNPLICSLICFVNFDRDGFVPDERGELYSIAIDALVERRDRERGIHQGLELSKAQKIKLLGYISDYFWMRSSSQVPAKDVSEFLKEYLPGVGLEVTQAPDLVDALGQRSHILRSPSEGYLDFSHKTFMEFFLARRIVDLNLRERVLENWTDPDFREVLYFIFALATPIFLRSILDDLIDEGSQLPHGSEALRYAAIVLQTATSEAAEIDPEQRAKISELLTNILPPKSNSEADALARTGDAIVEPLSKFSVECHRDSWAYCVRALVNCYSHEAIYALASYAKLGDPEVDRHLVSGRRLFEGEEYTRTVVRHCTTVQEFELNSHIDVEILGELKSLKSLSIKNYDDTWHDFCGVSNPTVSDLWVHSVDEVRDLSLIDSFPNISKLTVTDCHFLNDYSAISNLEQLRSLTIYSMELEDLSFLASCRNLQRLDVSECTQIRDVRCLNRLASLRELLLPYSSLYDQITLSGIAKDDHNLEIDSDVFEFDEDFPKRPPLTGIDDGDGYVGIPLEDDDDNKELRFD